MESESDEEPIAEEPRLRGALRGLDMSNMPAPPDAHHQTDTGEDARRNMPADTPQHETRASRHGKTPVNYSAKWHPMDEVMHPKRARRLAGGSGSRRRAGGDSDDSEPEPFSGGGTDDQDDADDMPDTPFERVPDAGATRRSARSEARKPVNYSKAHHPQDHLLPGYRNRAKRQRRSTSVTQPRKRKASSETVVLSSQTIADSEDDGSDANDSDCIQLQSTDPATTTTLSPREQVEEQSVRENRDMPTDVADDLHHILKAVPGLSRGESSFDPTEATIGLLHELDGTAFDSQQSSQAVDQNASDDGMVNPSTKALMSGVTAILASVEIPAAQGSEQSASKGVQGAPVPDRHSALRVSHHAKDTTSLPTPSSAMDKAAQAGSLSLSIVRPYSTPRVEPSAKCQPSLSQQSKDAEVSGLEVQSNESKSENEPVKSQERSDTFTSEDDPSQTEKHGSSDAAPQHRVARTGQTTRESSDSSPRASLTSHDPSDHVTALGPASRQASRDTQPDKLLKFESHFDAAISTSQSPSRENHEDDLDTRDITSPKLLESGQKQIKGSAAGLQLVSGRQPLVAGGEELSQPTVNGHQEGIDSGKDRASGSADGSKRVQSPHASSVPADSQREPTASSLTNLDDNLLSAGCDT